MAREHSQIDDAMVVQARLDQQRIEQTMTPLAVPECSPIRLYDAGAGEPIVFLPMVQELNFVYARQLAEFASDYRVLLYEPRLSRRSRVGITDRAAEVLVVMDTLGLPAAHLVAWSDTGSAAYVFAKQWPERCRSVVFLGLADRYRFPQPLQTLMGVLAHLPVEGLIPTFILAHILGHYLGGRQVKPAWVAEGAGQIPQLPHLFKHSILSNLMEHRPRAGEVNVPSLVLCGTDDALVTVAQVQRMARLLPKAAEAVIVPGGEHFLPYANAAEVNRSMRDFFQSVGSNAQG
jgi:pimeloyl-ACP methyl ester carboxylesterase